MAVKKEVKKTGRVIDATINMETHEGTNLKPIAWAIVASACILAGTYILSREYDYMNACRISYLDNSGMLLNSCAMYDETNDGLFTNDHVIENNVTKIN